MKTPEEMAAIFAAMPSKKKKNPYWNHSFKPVEGGKVFRISDSYGGKLCFNESRKTLKKIRDFFRLFYESFKTEAQVLCIGDKDAKKLKNLGIPVLTTGQIGPYGVTVFVLPQDNHMGTTVISEAFWQKYIVSNNIVPVARVHSHHILDPYQSGTDYSTLNSGSLEIVLGHIFEEPLAMCYWLDVPGTDIKANTFVAKEKDGVFVTVPHQFNGQKDLVPDDSITHEDMLDYGYGWPGMFPLRKDKTVEIFEKNLSPVYFLYEDGTEAEVGSVPDIIQHDTGGGIFGIHKTDWQKIAGLFTEQKK